MTGDGGVVIVTGADLSDGAPGGSRSYVVGLARALLRRGIRPTLLTNGEGVAQIDGADIVAVSPTHRRSSVRFLWDLFRWSRSHRLASGAIVHAQRPDDLVPILLTQEDIRPIVTLHGDALRGIRRRKGFGASSVERVLERFALRRACAVIAVDPWTGQAYRERLPNVAERMTVIPVAVDSEVFRPGLRDDARLALGLADGPVILYVGRLSPEKRVSELVRAMDLARLREATLVIVGDGPEEVHLRRLATGKRVRFLGRRPAVDVARCMNAADVLALPSEFEGMPTVALEALSCGCPVVAMKGTGLDHVIVPMATGLLADSLERFPEALAMGLASSSRMRDQCAASVSGFSWDRVGDAVVEVYESVRGAALA